MDEWAKVVTQPLGLVGFGLFLVFGYLGTLKRQDERRWPSRVAFGLATLALVGGLAIAYVQTPKPAPPAQPKQQSHPTQQTSTGAGSPNVQGVDGDVTITVDQSNGKNAATDKTPGKKSKQESQ
jgi:hypothetical protein